MTVFGTRACSWRNAVGCAGSPAPAWARTAVFLLAGLTLCAVSRPADARTDPLARCWSAKVAAASKYTGRVFDCERARRTPGGDDLERAACLAKAAEKLAGSWARHEQKSARRGHDCNLGIAHEEARALIDTQAADLRAAAEDEALMPLDDDADQRPLRRLLLHAGRLMQHALSAQSRHLKQPAYEKHERRIQRARDRFVRRWERALDAAGLAPSLDPAALAEDATEFVQRYAGEIVASAPGDGVGACSLDGVAFSPYADGQDPNDRTPIGPAQIYERLMDIRKHARAVRTYGVGDGLENIAGTARGLGFETHIGAWLDRDGATNREQIDNLVASCQAGEVDTAIVGSEVLLRGDMSLSTLLGYIAEVRAACPPEVAVTTAAITDTWLTNPQLVDAVDVVFLHAYPFWESAHIDDALRRLVDSYERVSDAAGATPVVIAETGWATAGEPVGDAVPSRRNAERYLRRAVTWAEDDDVTLFYFSSHDERWKIPHEGKRGAHWGLLSARGRMKAHARRTLRGCRRASSAELARHLGTGRIPDETTPGDPSFILTVIPAKGSFDNLRGRANFLVPREHVILTYIRVSGRWWTKPTAARPATPINGDGRFEVDVTTGGVDEMADRILVCLVPSSFPPPVALGARSVPSSVGAAASQCENVVR